MLTNSREVKGLPNIKSAIKRVKIIQRKNAENSIQKSHLKNTVKKCKDVIAKNDASASEQFKNTTQIIDKAAAKKIIHKNTASRRKSRLAKALNAANTVK